jgi:hypothetical protein
MRTRWQYTYLQHMTSKPIELPPAVARRFVEDMRAFFAARAERGFVPTLIRRP